MRKYRCENCKEASFKSQLLLTRHLGKCKKGIRPSAKGKLAKCPECSEKINFRGLGSHRRSAHGIAGTSRWSIQAKNKKAAKQVTLSDIAAVVPHVIPVITYRPGGTGIAGSASGRSPSVSRNQGIEKSLLDQAAIHREKAVEHLNKAERLTKMAVELKEMSS